MRWTFVSQYGGSPVSICQVGKEIEGEGVRVGEGGEEREGEGREGEGGGEGVGGGGGVGGGEGEGEEVGIMQKEISSENKIKTKTIQKQELIIDDVSRTN